MEYDQPRSWDLVARYAGLSALAGLLLGLLEAAYLSTHASYPSMLKPDVAWVIWFLGPLLDAAGCGFIGLVSALAITTCRGRQGWQRTVEYLRVHSIVIAPLGISVIAVLAAYALVGSGVALRTLKVTAVLLLPTVAHRLGRSLRLRTLGMSLSIALFILLAGLGAFCLRPSLLANGASGRPENGRGKPNIILITLDTVRADHVSLYGYSRPTTPNIDRWAQGGVVFENAIAPTSWTLPSHASMFTGLLPHQHGADWQVPLNTTRWTMADVLKAWGYETAGFTSNIGYGEAGWGLDAGFDKYDDDRISLLHNLEELGLGRVIIGPLYRRYVWPEHFERRRAARVNRDIFDWFHRPSPRPFFLFINYFDAHDPYFVPEEFSHRFGDYSPDSVRQTQFVFGTGRPVHLPGAGRAALIAGYDNSLASLDHAVGELLNALSQLPSWKNTVVIITSDHGEGFGDHDTYCHGLNLYSEVVHVPLIIFGPSVPEGLRISHLVPTQDLFSTVLEFAGEVVARSSHTGLQRYWTPGTDFRELDESVVSELTPKYPSDGLWPQMSLRTEEWAYIRNSRGEEELYRWRRDPAERVNLAGTPEYRQIVASLHARLCTLVSDSRRPWPRPQYLSALDEPPRNFVNVAGAFAEFASTPGNPVLHIGEAQDGFPPKAVAASGMPAALDSDLLRSLPYH